MMKTTFAALAALLLALVPVGSSANHDHEWIQEKYSYCCNHDDCFDLDPAQVIHKVEGGEGLYIVKWRGAVHEIPERKAKKSERHKPWVCENPDQTIRCLFVLPMGS